MENEFLFDTKSMMLFEDDLSEHPDNYERWSEGYAQLAVKKALEAENYGSTDNLIFRNYSCKIIKEGSPSSEVCYLETDMGYFFLMRDMVDHINVIYNRWD